MSPAANFNVLICLCDPEIVIILTFKLFPEIVLILTFKFFSS